MGQTKYITVQGAVDAAPSGQAAVVQMLANSSENVVIKGGQKITLDLNGYVLKGIGLGAAITIKSGGELTIADNNTAQPTHYFQYSPIQADEEENSPYNVWRYIGDTYSGEDTPDDALTVSLANPAVGKVVKVTGGCITGGCYGGHGLSGGGVSCDRGTLTVSGGSIVGNAAVIYAKGGGVYVYNGSFTMTGGSICCNEAIYDGEPAGGGVYLSDSTFTMTGGIICNNVADNCGGGAYWDDESSVTLGGTAKIKNNFSQGQANNLVCGPITLATGNDSLTGDAEIHFTLDGELELGEYPFATAASNASQCQYFRSDDERFIVQFVAGTGTGAGYLALVPPSVCTVGDTGYYSIEAALDATEETAGETSQNPTTIKLTSDITEDVTIPAGRYIALDLNGHVLQGTGTGSVITNNGELTIKDSDTTGVQHKFAPDASAYGCWTLDETGGTETVTGGVITGGLAPFGGGIYNKATMMLESGSIVGNVATGSNACTGGGVCSAGQFTMTGGTVAHNLTIGTAASFGGGIGLMAGTATMTGGSITGNSAVLAEPDDDPEDEDNESFVCGGGVYVNMDVGLTAGGTLVVDGNTADGRTNNLGTAAPFTLGTFKNGAKIGVTLFDLETQSAVSGPLTTNTVENASNYIFCDDGRSSLVSVTGDETTAGYVEIVQPPVCEVGDEQYSSIAEALADTEETTESPTTAIKLIANTTEDVAIEAGRCIELDLNGYVLQGTGKQSVVQVQCQWDETDETEIYGELTIIDSNNPSQTHKFTVDENGLWNWTDTTSSEVGYTFSNGVLTKTTEEDDDIPTSGAVIAVTGGCITGGVGMSDDGTYGGGIYNEGELTISDGNIVGNMAEQGGGIYSEGCLTITGGNIVGNSAMEGGGVCSYDFSFTMTGGTITGNMAYGSSYAVGGGVCLYGSNSGITAALTGGTIKGNSVVLTEPDDDLNEENSEEEPVALGGGIYVFLSNQDSLVTIGGTLAVKDNTADGAASNLVLDEALLTLGTGNNALSGETGRIGITVLAWDESYTVPYAAKGAFTTNGTSAEKGYFFSDNTAYHVAVAGTETTCLELTDEPEETAKDASTLTIEAIEAQTYTGSAIEPDVVVKDGNTILTEGTDYTVAYQNNTNAGTATVTVTCKGNYSGSTSITFTVDPKTVTVTAGTYTITKVWNDTTDAGTASGSLSADGIRDADRANVTVHIGTLPIYPRTDAGSYNLDLPISISGDTNGNYRLASETVSVPASITQALIAVPSAVSGLTYSAAVQTGVLDGTGYALTGNTGTAVGTYTATATLEDTNNYQWSDGTTEPKKISWKIAPCSVIITPVADQNKSYGASDPTLNYTTDLTEEALITAFGKPDILTRTKGEDAGTYAISLKSGASVKNFTLALAEGVFKFTVNKADWTNMKASGAAKYGNSGTVDLGAYLAPGYTIGNLTKADASNVLSGTPTVSGSTFSFAFAASAAAGSTATVTVPVLSSVNYEPYNITVTLTVNAKDAQVLDFASAAVTKTYGDASFTNTLTQSVGNGAVTYTSSNTAVAEVHPTTGEVTVLTAGNAIITAAAAETSDYAKTMASYALTVKKAALIVTAEDKAITKGDSIPDFDCTVRGLKGTDSVAFTAETAADGTTVGTFEIVPQKQTLAKYEVSYVNGKLSVMPEVTEDQVEQIKTSSAATITDETPAAFGETKVEIKSDEVPVEVQEDLVDMASDVETQNEVLAKAATSDQVEAVTGKISNDGLGQALAELADTIPDVNLNDAEVVIQTSVEIEITGYEENPDTSEKTIVLDITPQVSVALSVEDTEGNTVKATIPGTETAITVSEPITITVPIPEGFAEVDDTIYVVHKDKVFECKVQKNDETQELYIEFTESDGFSPFTFSTTNQIAAKLTQGSTTTNYSSLAAALFAAEAGATITVLKDCSSETIGNKIGFALTLKLEGSDAKVPALTAADGYTKTQTADGYTFQQEEQHKDTDRDMHQGGTVTGRTSADAETAEEPIKEEVPVVPVVEPVIEQPEEPVTEEPETTPDIGAVELPFTDVAESDWFYAAVSSVYDKGLMNGISDHLFDPNGSTTRAMVATILWRLAGSPTALGNGGFTDVEMDQWYTTAIAWGTGNGLLKGYGDGTFGPSDPITREQLVTILYRLAVANGVDVSVGEDTNILSYNDAFDISEYAIPAFQWACGVGLVEGSNGYLMPTDTATRAQIATLIMRVYEILK